MTKQLVLAFLLSLLTWSCQSNSAQPESAARSQSADVYVPTVPDSALPGLDAQSIPEVLQKAYEAAGPDYVARTHHKHPDGRPKFINRLMLESSPYLLQHAHNPVNWYPWGDEAFERAEKEDKLVLLSVGYSTCHWCHVMERESFEDEEIAGYINENYVAIKVDREERPDVDKIYMSAVQMMTGRGGWPMTVLMTFDRLPVFAGTYFPPRDGVRGSRRGFSSILKEYRTLYLRDPQELVSNGQDIAQRVVQRAQPAGSADIPNEQALLSAVGGLSDGFDPVHGGFGRAPKFPRSSNLELLSRHYRRSGDRRSLEMLETTLDKMAAGGMYDQIGGGFHRYSTDARWLVPHFEKMLYDNAQLVVAYLEAFQITGKGDYARVAREILDYVMREMTHQSGGFYSATDADSPAPSGHDEEGLFFTWTPRELKEVLGPGDAALLVQKFYGVTARGNFEGRSILNVTEPLDVIARALNMTLREAEAHLAGAKTKLYEKRLERKPPILDDKILTSWNGLMISAFAKASFTLNEPRYAEAAKRAASFLLSSVWDGTHLKRTWRNGETKYAAYLDDYAFLAAGLLDLYEATGESAWLAKAQSLQTTLDARFWDGRAGGYFFVADDHETLLAREKPDYDGAVPAGNSVAALNLQRLALLTGDDAFRRRAELLMKGFGGALRRYGRGLPKLLTALDFHLDEPLQVVIVRPSGGGEANELLRPLRETFVPNRVLVRVAESEVGQLAQRMPPIAGKKCKDGKPTAYVCRGPICTRPMISSGKLKGELAKVVAYGAP